MKKQKLTQVQRLSRLEKVASANYLEIKNLQSNLLGLIKELKEIGKIPRNTKVNITEVKENDLKNLLNE